MAKAFNISTDGKTTVNHINGWNSDIITTIHNNVPAATKQMKEVAQTFNKGNEMETARAIWNFLKKEIKYVKDPDGYQNIKLPGRFVATGSGDCKSYSLFTASILENLNIPYSFRYTSYGINPTPQHVYIVTDSGIIIDGVWNKFNSEKAYTSKKDYKMKIQTLSGIGCNSCDDISSPFSRSLRSSVRSTVRSKRTKAMPRTAVQTARSFAQPGLTRTATSVANQSRRIKPRTTNLQPMPLGSVVMIGNTMPVGNIFKKGAKAVKKGAQNLKKAAVKVQDKAKSTGLVKAAAKVQTKAKNTGIVRAAAKLQDRVKKEGGKVITLAAPRRAYRTLVSINFRGFATQLNKNRAKAGEIFEKQGGKASELFQSIDKGIKRKAIFPSKESKIQSVNGIGEVATATTVAAALAVATPIILAFTEIVKSAAAAKKSAQDLFTPGAGAGDGSEAPGAGADNNFSPDPSAPNNNNSASGETTDPNNVAPSSGSSMLTPLLYIGGAFLLAKATKII
jgi:hypothetical protein